MGQFIEGRLKLYHTELQSFVWIGSITFVVVFVDAMLRNYSDAAFLKYFGPDRVPWVWIAGAIVSIGLIGLLRRWASFLRDHLVLGALLAVWAVGGLILFILIQAGVVIAYAVLSFMVYVVESIIYIYLWNLGGTLFDTRQSKRIFPLIASVIVLGRASGSFSTRLVSVTLGSSSTLLVLGVSFVALAILVATTGPRLVKSSGDRGGSTKSSPPRKGFTEIAGLIRGHDLLRYLVVSSVAANILIPIFNFQFMVIAHTTFPSESGMIWFFSILRGVTPLATLFILLLAGSRYGKTNLATVSLTHPINFSLLFVGLGAFFNIFVAAYGSFSVGVIQDLVVRPVRNVLCGIMPKHTIAWTRSFINGTCVKFGALCGCSLILLLKSIVSPQQFSLFAEPLALFWLIETFRFRKHYRQVLKTRLAEAKIDFDRLDAAYGFRGAHSAIQLGADWDESSRQERGAGETDEAPIMHPDVALRLIDSPDPQERAEAAGAFSVHRDLRAVRKLVDCLDSPDYAVREAAVYGLRHYGEEILPYLEVSLVKASPRVREGILQIVRLAGHQRFQGHPFLNREVLHAYGNLISCRCLRSMESSPSLEMLRSCLLEENDEIIRGILHWLWVRQADMALVYETLNSENASLAVELLERSIDRRLAEVLIPLMEDIPLDSKIDKGRKLLFLLEEEDPERLLTFIMRYNSLSTRAIALYVVGDRMPLPCFVPSVEAYAESSDPFQKEMAEFALARIRREPVEIPELIKRVSTLSGFPIMSEIGVRGRVETGIAARLENYSKGDIIIEQGDPASSIYFVISGKIVVYNDYGTPEQRPDETVEPGQTTAAWTWQEGLAVQGTYVAVQDTEALVLSTQDFANIMLLFPQISISLCTLMSLQLRETVDPWH